MKILQSYRQMLAGIVVLACTAAQSPCGGGTSANRSAPAARGATVASVIPFTGVVPFVVGDPTLVSAEWRQGLGCPTNLPFPFACFSAADPTDNVNAGLILAKSGPTTSDPAVDLSLYPAGINTDLPPYAAAELQGVAGARVADLAELGYDLRKFFFPPVPDNPAGSHCGLRAPRFDVVTQGTAGPSTHFFYCVSGVVDNVNLGWLRMRWTPDQAVPPMDPADTIQSIKIVFDEGVDPAGGLPDLFGLAVLDNIDVNGILVGNAQPANQFPDEDDGQGEDDDHDDFHFHESSSHGESSRMSYSDKSRDLKFVAMNGARSIHHDSSNCVSFVADGTLNGKPGYVANLQTCDLSGPQKTAIGNFSITITGPGGFLYQKTATLRKGRVKVRGT